MYNMRRRIAVLAVTLVVLMSFTGCSAEAAAQLRMTGDWNRSITAMCGRSR